MIRNLLVHAENGDKTAVIEDGQILSYRDLLRRAAAVQNQLPEKEQKNIAILLPNSADYIAALFGTFMAGMTAFPLNVQLTAHEIAPLLSKAAANTIITSLPFNPLVSGMADCTDFPLNVIYMEQLSSYEGETPSAPVYAGANEPMVLLTTSGTTGNAKIVQLSEQNLDTTVHGFSTHNYYEKFDESTIKYTLGTPFSSVYGLLILSTCLMKSFPIVIPKETITLDLLYRMAQEHKITHYEGGATIPILMDQMSDRAIPYDISSLKFIGYGGSKVTADVLLRLAKAFPEVHVCTGYGSTESASLITRPYRELPADKLDSVGIAIPNVTVKVEADGIITAAPRTTGEVVVTGPNVMLGYYESEEETRKIIKDGYLYTGDIGYFDEEGYLYLCGRKKNVIKVRGFSVYAEEVESCLLNSGLLQDCLVYGQTDAFDNETLCADVVPADTQIQIDELRIYCKEHLADYKCPQRFQAVERIEKTATGKSKRTT